MNEDITSNAENNHASGNRIYEYLKKQPTVFIAAVSAAVAVVSFATNAVIYIFASRYLLFWGYNIAQCDYRLANQVYIISMSIISMIGIHIMQRYCDQTFSVYYQRNSHLFISKKLYKLLIKQNTDYKRRLSRVSSHLRKNNDVEFIARLHSEGLDVETLSNEIKATKNDIYDLRNTISQSKWQKIGWLLVLLVPSVIITALAMMLFLTMLGVVWLPIWIYVITALLYSLFVILISWLISRSFGIITIKQNLKAAGENIEELKLLFHKAVKEKQDSKEYPFFKWMNYRLKDFIGNSKNIRVWSLYYILFFVVLFIVLAYSMTAQQEKRSTFPVYSEGDKSYVIVYQSPEFCYMDKAEISEQSIMIDTREHRIVSSQNICYNEIKFDEVTILRDQVTSIVHSIIQ